MGTSLAPVGSVAVKLVGTLDEEELVATLSNVIPPSRPVIEWLGTVDVIDVLVVVLEEVSEVVGTVVVGVVDGVVEGVVDVVVEGVVDVVVEGVVDVVVDGVVDGVVVVGVVDGVVDGVVVELVVVSVVDVPVVMETPEIGASVNEGEADGLLELCDSDSELEAVNDGLSASPSPVTTESPSGTALRTVKMVLNAEELLDSFKNSSASRGLWPGYAMRACKKTASVSEFGMVTSA